MVHPHDGELMMLRTDFRREDDATAICPHCGEIKAACPTIQWLREQGFEHEAVVARVSGDSRYWSFMKRGRLKGMHRLLSELGGDRCPMDCRARQAGSLHVHEEGRARPLSPTEAEARLQGYRP